MSLMLALVGSTMLASAPVQFDRIDILNEQVPTFLHYDVPTTKAYPLGTAMRFVEQLNVAFTLPLKGLYVNASLRSQGLTYEGALLPSSNGRGLFWMAGISTRLLMPYGAQVGLAYRVGFVRLSLGVQAASGATWARPSFGQWQVLPTLGLGFGPNVGAGRR